MLGVQVGRARKPLARPNVLEATRNGEIRLNTLVPGIVPGDRFAKITVIFYVKYYTVATHIFIVA